MFSNESGLSLCGKSILMPESPVNETVCGEISSFSSYVVHVAKLHVIFGHSVSQLIV
jgi:hypothetical protein